MTGSQEYESAMLAFQRRLYRTQDGCFALDAENGGDIGIADPVVFADLKRSMEETDKRIRRGEIDPKAIEYSSQ